MMNTPQAVQNRALRLIGGYFWYTRIEQMHSDLENPRLKTYIKSLSLKSLYQKVKSWLLVYRNVLRLFQILRLVEGDISILKQFLHKSGPLSTDVDGQGYRTETVPELNSLQQKNG